MTVPRISLTSNGPEFSRIVHGLCRLAEWNLTNKQTAELIDSCLELGITTFDHADIYGGYLCEDLFGAALAGMSVERSSIELVTKCGIKTAAPSRPSHTMSSYDTTAAHILQSVDASLKNLRTDYIDVLLIHRPDPLMDAREVAEAFTQLKESGKVLHFGVSNFLPCQFELLAAALDFPLVTNQIEYSPMHMECQADGSIDLCQKRGIAPMAWSPLGGGRLFTSETEQAKRLRAQLQETGANCGGASIAQVALAFVLKHPVNFLPVIGTGKTDRVRSAAKALDITLTHEQWFAIWVASMGHGVP